MRQHGVISGLYLQASLIYQTQMRHMFSIRLNIIHHGIQHQPAPSLTLCCSGQGLTAASIHTLTHTHTHTHTQHTHTHTHTHTHVGFCGLRGLSIGVMVFILNKLCVLLPYTYPIPKLGPHRRLCAFLNFQKNTI